MPDRADPLSARFAREGERRVQIRDGRVRDLDGLVRKGLQAAETHVAPQLRKWGAMITPHHTTTSRRGGRPPRFLLYSHDSWGLGHLRRSLTIAEELVASFPGAGVLIATGSPCATHFEPAPGIDLVKLPSVSKDGSGAYVPRKLPGDVERVVRLRARLLLEAYRGFAPDLVLVDHQVVGLMGEALPLLEQTRRDRVPAVLGIRDIIDAPEVVAREWGSAGARWALREGYDRVCVYGAPEVFDPRAEYPIPPELGPALEFTGYVVRPSAPRRRRPVPSLRPQVLVTMGGGEDGAERVSTYLGALEQAPADWDSTVVLGPMLAAPAARQLKRRARLIGGVRVHRFHDDLPGLLADSQAVVGMAGYNTVAEILDSGKPAVFLPRTHPRREQLLRASRLAALGLARSLCEPTPAVLRAAVEATLAHGSSGRPVPPLDGSRRICAVIGELLGRAPRVEAPDLRRVCAS